MAAAATLINPNPTIYEIHEILRDTHESEGEQDAFDALEVFGACFHVLLLLRLLSLNVWLGVFCQTSFGRLTIQSIR